MKALKESLPYFKFCNRSLLRDTLFENYEKEKKKVSVRVYSLYSPAESYGNKGHIQKCSL